MTVLIILILQNFFSIINYKFPLHAFFKRLNKNWNICIFLIITCHIRLFPENNPQRNLKVIITFDNSQNINEDIFFLNYSFNNINTTKKNSIIIYELPLHPFFKKLTEIGRFKSS